MKKYLVTLLLTIFMNFAFGQTEKIADKSVVESFEMNYNSDSFEAIFSSFSIEMQNALPLDKTK